MTSPDISTHLPTITHWSIGVHTRTETALQTGLSSVPMRLTLYGANLTTLTGDAHLQTTHSCRGDVSEPVFLLTLSPAVKTALPTELFFDVLSSVRRAVQTERDRLGAGEYVEDCPTALEAKARRDERYTDEEETKSRFDYQAKVDTALETALENNEELYTVEMANGRVTNRLLVPYQAETRRGLMQGEGSFGQASCDTLSIDPNRERFIEPMVEEARLQAVADEAEGKPSLLEELQAEVLAKYRALDTAHRLSDEETRAAITPAPRDSGSLTALSPSQRKALLDSAPQDLTDSERAWVSEWEAAVVKPEEITLEEAKQQAKEAVRLLQEQGVLASPDEEASLLPALRDTALLLAGALLLGLGYLVGAM